MSEARQDSEKIKNRLSNALVEPANSKRGRKVNLGYDDRQPRVTAVILVQIDVSVDIGYLSLQVTLIDW